jgi:hypothetical protein
MRRRSTISGNTRSSRARQAPSRRVAEARVRAFAAINRVRRGQSKTLSSAARAENTTVKSIRRLLPSALLQDRPGGRIRVKVGDRYSARVEIFTGSAPLHVTAHGSRERELAGRHRATVIKVLRGDEPASALHQFRGKSVGGHPLVTDINALSEPAHGGVLDQLDSLYVTPDTSA